MRTKGYFSAPFERFVREEASEGPGAFTLFGLFSSYSMRLLRLC